MINEELLDEIIYVSLKNEYISKKLIEKIVLDIIVNCDLITQNEFGGLYFEKMEWDFAIAALKPDSTIVADYDEILDISKGEQNQTYLEKNLYILKYLMHEIEHLKEYSKKLKGDYEAKIIKFGDGAYIYDRYYLPMFSKTKKREFSENFASKKYKLFYKNNWSIIPCERIAEITSRKNLLDSLKQYPDYEKNYFKEYKRLTNFYINGLKLAYRKLESGRYNVPIIEYFTNLDRLSDIKRLGFDAESKKMRKEIKILTPQTRMMYGMPITPKDIIEINKMKIKTGR